MVLPPGKSKKNTKNFDQESWGQNQILCAARESNVNELDRIPSRPSEARQRGPRILGAKPNILKKMRYPENLIFFSLKKMKNSQNQVKNFV